jgi:chloramphenicol O-acetyltransferase type A
VSGQKSEPGASGHYLDVEKWKRREHFELYRGFTSPFFSVTVELDVTELWRGTRAPGPSFFLASIFCALRAANTVEAFRARVRGDRVWIHDQVSIGPTVLRADNTFAFARLEPAGTFAEFVTRSEPLIRDACEVRPLVATYATDDVIYQTTLPWLRFTSFSNAIEGAGDSVPRVAFGKCSEDSGRWNLPVSVEVHHAVVDGLDVARFLEELQRGFADFFIGTDGR